MAESSRNVKEVAFCFAVPRLEWVDVARGIAMLAIVVHHLFYARSTLIAGMFDVPLFFFISGFFLSSKQESFKAFALKKCKQLVKPYLIICAVIVLGSLVLGVLAGSGIAYSLDQARYWLLASLCGLGEDGILPFPMPSIGAIWFLLALFWGLLLTKRFLVESPYAAWIMIVFVCIGCGTALYATVPWSIQMGMMATLFIYAGYLARQNGFFDQRPKPVLITGCLITFAFAYLAQTRISMVSCIFDPVAVVVAFAALLLVLFLSKEVIVRITFLSRFLQFVGKNTLIILGAHLFDLNLLSLGGGEMLDSIGNTYLEGMAAFCVKISFYLAIVVAIKGAKTLFAAWCQRVDLVK